MSNKKHSAVIPEPQSRFYTKAHVDDSSIPVSNLTGGQIQEILDFLILSSLTPLVLASDVFNVQIAYLVSLTAQNRKRKVSALPRDEFISLMSKALLVEDKQQRVNLIAAAKIERSFLYNFVVNFLKFSEPYRELYVQYMRAKRIDKLVLDKKLETIERSLSMTRDQMFPAINVAQDYLELAYRFRNSIVENYIKKAHKQAHAFVKMKGNNFDFQDVSQNFLTAITRAIDKYDSSKGAITSYINWWVINAQSSSQEHDHEYGVAFTIPQLQRRKLAQGEKGDINFSVSLDALLKNKDDESFDLASMISNGEPSIEYRRSAEQELWDMRCLIKRTDRNSLARLYLDIDEAFSPRECRQMVATMELQGIPVPENILKKFSNAKAAKHKLNRPA